MGSQYGLEGKPEWFDRAVQMKLDNPRITATEIARQIGISNSNPVVYWLTGASLFEAGLVALVEPCINGCWYYLLDRICTNLNKGGS